MSQEQLKPIVERWPALRFALVALKLFRERRDNPDHTTQRWLVREYVAQARLAGFRGSVNVILGQLEAEAGGVR